MAVLRAVNPAVMTVMTNTSENSPGDSASTATQLLQPQHDDSGGEHLCVSSLGNPNAESTPARLVQPQHDQTPTILTPVPAPSPSTSQSDADSCVGPIVFSIISEMSKLSTPQANQQDKVEQPLTHWHGFKVVGDNVDKTIKPRHMREDRQTKSVHYFQIYAVKDRVDLSNHSDEPRSPGKNPPLSELLPSTQDKRALLANLTTIITRLLAEYMPVIKENFGDTVTQHIPHPYSSEMAKKSDVVGTYLLLLQTIL